MTISFSTKASTLASVAGNLKTASVAPLYYFTVDDWLKDADNCLSHINKFFADDTLVIRSSSRNEDTEATSNAGGFLSLLNVQFENVSRAIFEVIDSYGNADKKDEVLVQPMLTNVVLSGVAFSHDPNTYSPYKVINWFEGEDTTFITSGKGGRTWQQSGSIKEAHNAPSGIGKICNLIDELLGLFFHQPIDCEFAITLDENKKEQLWLLQVRPLILKQQVTPAEKHKECLQRVYNKVKNGMNRQPFLKGSRTVYGVMPDWNPAEIIGVRPKGLALSLYGELITNSIWAYQRHNYGYRNLRSFPLMLNFNGLPYIDLRVSFNSFVPADIDDVLADRLVDYYIGSLEASPELHDKIEFEIVYSCYTLDLPERLKMLSEFGFSNKDQMLLLDSLRSLTNKIIHPEEGLWKKDAEKLNKLHERRELIFKSKVEPLERIYWLLEDVKRYGTLPFAGLARAGFIAIQMLRSLVSSNILSEEDYNAFLASVSTVSGQLAFDRCNLDKTTFLSRYGHLRPGTYDILSYRYDEKPELYFDWENTPNKPAVVKPFSLTLVQMKALKELLIKHGLNADPVALFDFIQSGIEQRELAKFHFTKNLSDILSLIGDFGAQYGISREDMAYCDIAVFKDLYVSSLEPSTLIKDSIKQGKSHYLEAKSIALPPLITSAEDVWAFEWPMALPNFITQKQVTANVSCGLDKESISGSIVCIPNADPGFDWLFSYPIAGLVTAWGGANSHMAIRASELEIPAVIGAGEKLYKKWSDARCLSLDCSGRRVEVLE